MSSNYGNGVSSSDIEEASESEEEKTARLATPETSVKSMVERLRSSPDGPREASEVPRATTADVSRSQDVTAGGPTVMTHDRMDKTQGSQEIIDRFRAKAEGLRRRRAQAFADIRRTLERMNSEVVDDPSWYDDPTYDEWLARAERLERDAAIIEGLQNVALAVGRWSQRKLRVEHPDDAYARGYDQARLDAAVMVELNHPEPEAAFRE